MLAQTSVGSTRVWFGELEIGSTDNFKELERKFEMYFMQQRRYIKVATNIAKSSKEIMKG